MIQEFIKIGVEPKGNRKEQKVKCPECKSLGKTNWKDDCLSINIESGLYNCHKCGWKGCVKIDENFKQMEYTKPTKQNFTKLSEGGLKLFSDRGITQQVVNANKIVMSKDGKSVIFPYLMDGELINYKQRFLDKKDFRQAKDAKAIMFNYDRCKGQKEIIVCEGEFDAMAFEVSGFEYATSVNQGAPNVNDKNIDKKLECITNCYDMFETAEKVFIAVDNDPNGRRLKDELIRRIGAEKCYIVDFKECKDANDYLLKYNNIELKDTIKDAKAVPVEGVFSIEDARLNMLDTFRNGKVRGTTTYWKEIDNAWTWRTKEVTLWTGYQNEGKSLFLQSLCLLKAFHEGEKFAFFTPENLPMSDFYDDIIETLVGKSSDPMYKSNQMREDEYLEAIEWVKDKFFLIYPDKNFTIETILDKAKYLVRRKGVNHIVFDPYNTIEHKMKMGEREDLYISRFMSELKRFSIDNNVGIHLVAHQLTPQKDAAGRYVRPDLNRIKGGGTFSDKADNVCFVWRPERALDFSNTDVVFGSQKIKKQKLVGIPQDVMEITFNRKTNRYYINGVSPFDEVDKLRSTEPIQLEIKEDAIKPNNNFETEETDLFEFKETWE